MDIRPIRTKEDHRAALAAIDALRPQLGLVWLSLCVRHLPFFVGQRKRLLSNNTQLQLS
jgi:hypothetical protein